MALNRFCGTEEESMLNNREEAIVWRRWRKVQDDWNLKHPEGSFPGDSAVARTLLTMLPGKLGLHPTIA